MDCHYRELSNAASVDDVLQITRRYLSSWAPAEIERLPDTCRPGHVDSSRDIERWADLLIDEGPKAALFSDDERRLDRLTNHFLIASVRIRQLARAED